MLVPPFPSLYRYKSRKLWVAWIWKASTRSLSESGVYAEVMDPSRCGVLLGSDKHGMVLGPWLLPVSSASLWKRAALPWSTLHDLLWYHRSKTTNQAALGWNSKTMSQVNILAFKLTLSGISRQGRKGQNKRFSRKGIRGDLQVEKNQCAFSASKTWRLKNESVYSLKGWKQRD